jgi:hypothetical protein
MPHPLEKMDLPEVQVSRHPKSDTGFAIVHRETLCMISYAKGAEELVAPTRTVRDDWICALTRAVVLGTKYNKRPDRACQI